MAQPLHGLEILVVEDEPLWRREVAATLEAQGALVSPASNLEEARRCLGSQTFDFALLDIHLPDGNSLDLLRAGQIETTWGIVVMTAEGAIKGAVEAMRLGASDYLAKPFEPEELSLVFGRLRRQRRAERIGKHERARAEHKAGAFFFGRRLAPLRGTLERILETDTRLGKGLPPILIHGETGTGKSSLARWIHNNGPRAAQPFLEINCAALPETLAETELFGYDKGAFTDAKSDRLGLFEAAHGGTLFLDEIGSLSPAVQAKLLLAVESGEIRRVGGRRPIPVDVRLIAASLEDLDSAVRARRFREDLFHRLNLLSLTLPPLREHPGEIPATAEFLLERLKSRYRRPAACIPEPGMRRLRSGSWPGNVRELAHQIERALILAADDVLLFEHLDSDASIPGDESPLLNPHWELPESGFVLDRSLHELELAVIDRALHRAEGNLSAAARLLGVQRDYIRYRLRNRPDNK